MNPNSSPQQPPAGSPQARWGSPALAPMASFPPFNRMPTGMQTPPMQRMHGGFRGSRSFGGPAGPGGSPQFHPRGQFQPSFRTPQHHIRRGSPGAQNYRPPWTDGKGSRRPRQFDAKSDSSPRQNFSPGGGGEITQYYHDSMMSDPWQDTPPLPVNHWLQQT